MNWIYTKPKPTDALSSCPSKFKTALEKFKPNVWSKYEWQFFQSRRRYLYVLAYCFFVLSVDCNNFFLKFIVWVPPDHSLLKYRLCIWAFSAIASTKELYEYMSNKYCYRIGPFIWLATFTLLMEFSIIVKNGMVMFNEPFPESVKVIWTCIFLILCSGFIYAWINEKKAEKE